MEPPSPTFDPFDHSEPGGSTATWLAAFSDLENGGDYGNLDFTEAGVMEFDFVSGTVDEWASVLKEKVNEILDDLDSSEHVEFDQADVLPDLTSSLHTSMAYSSRMLKEDAANAWATSFVNSMEGGKFYHCPDQSVTSHTFDKIFVAVVGNKLAYMLINDED